METIIISPWLIYFISVVSSVRAALIAATVILLFAAAISVCVALSTYNSPLSGDARVHAAVRKFIKPLLITGVICMVFSILVPSQETLIYMNVVKLGTRENIKLTVDAAKEVMDYITHSISTIVD